MAFQTAESGRNSGEWGKRAARLVARAVGAEMSPTGGKSQRSNLCTFHQRPAAIKMAGRGTTKFLIYKSVLAKTELMIFAHQVDNNNKFEIYQIESARIPHITRKASHKRHTDTALVISLSLVRTYGTLIANKRLPAVTLRKVPPRKPGKRRQRA